MAQDNTSRQAVPTDVGFKISKPGYNATRTAGNNLVFSSSWPVLQEVVEYVIPNTIHALTDTAIYGHTLKYPPLVFTWVYGTDPVGLSGCYRRLMALTSVTSTTFSFSTSGLTTPETDFLLSASFIIVKLLQLDLTKDIDYVLAPGDTFKLPYDPNFGFKVAKQGKDINSKDLRDFTVHSRAQSPLVLAVKTEQTANTANPATVQYSHKLKYPVWVYGFVRSTAGSYRFAPYAGQSYPVTATDGFISTLSYQSGAGDNGATLVVLRDPMFAPTNVTAQY